MKNSILALAALALTAACGSDNGDLFSDYDADAGELGELEQPFRGKNTPTYQFGTQTGSARQKCNKTSTGQVCAIPPAKSLTYCIHKTQSVPTSDPSVFSSAQYSQVKTMVQGIDTFTDFTFTETTGTDCTLVPGQMNFFKAPVGSSGTSSADVKDYATEDFNGQVGLTEGTGVVGSYVNWTTCKAKIDVVDILAKGTSTTQDTNGMNHAVAHTSLACMGIGGRTTQAGRAARNLFDPSSTATEVSPGEACQILGYTLTDPGAFNLSATGACTAD